MGSDRQDILTRTEQKASPLIEDLFRRGSGASNQPADQSQTARPADSSQMQQGQVRPAEQARPFDQTQSGRGQQAPMGVGGDTQNYSPLQTINRAGSLLGGLATSMDARAARGDRMQNMSDQVAAQQSAREVTVRYGDPQLDAKMSAPGVETLRINGLPPGVTLSSWMDDRGFFFWFKNGNDNRAPHYLPHGLKQIIVDGHTIRTDEMKIDAAQGLMAEQNRGYGFGSLNQRTNPIEFASRMGGVALNTLTTQERWLREAAQDSPNNPYFRIYLADAILGQAIQPVIDQVRSGGNINLQDPRIMQRLDEALNEVKRAQGIASTVGGHRRPNETIQQPLSPFSLNPHHYNPDLYWGGAMYQAWQREVAITMLRRIIQSGVRFELPPALPPG